MAIDRSKVRRRLMVSWWYTFVVFLTMTLVVAVLGFILTRFAGPRVLMAIGVSGLTLGTLTFLLSPVIITMLLQASVIDREKFPEIYRAMDELYQDKWILFRPTIYFIKMPMPNAMAFGWGPFRGIAITGSLNEMMDYAELRAVLGHEFGHLRSRDVPVITALTIIIGGARECSKLFFKGATSLGKSPAAFIVGGLFYLFAKVLAPIGTAALSQEREYSADALSALYTGEVEPLCSALSKLAGQHNQTPARARDNMLSDLTISHPNMGNRLDELRALKPQKETPNQ